MGHGPAVRPGGGHCVPSRHTRGWANKGATSFSLMMIGMGVSLFPYPYLHSIYLFEHHIGHRNQVANHFLHRVSCLNRHAARPQIRLVTDLIQPVKSTLADYP